MALQRALVPHDEAVDHGRLRSEGSVASGDLRARASLVRLTDGCRGARRSPRLDTSERLHALTARRSRAKARHVSAHEPHRIEPLPGSPVHANRHFAIWATLPIRQLDAWGPTNSDAEPWTPQERRGRPSSASFGPPMPICDAASGPITCSTKPSPTPTSIKLTVDPASGPRGRRDVSRENDGSENSEESTAVHRNVRRGPMETSKSTRRRPGTNPPSCLLGAGSFLLPASACGKHELNLSDFWRAVPSVDIHRRRGRESSGRQALRCAGFATNSRHCFFGLLH